MAEYSKFNSMDWRDLRIEAGFYIANDEIWEDAQFPAQAINPPGQASDPDRDATTGLLLFAAAGTELIYAFQQFSHSWKEGSNIVPHVHWAKTTNAAGNVAWNCKYRKVPIGEAWGDWVDLGIQSVAVQGTPDIDTAGQQLINSWGELTIASDLSISDCILWEISRLGGDASDTYGADAYLFEFDVHYQKDSWGSNQQFAKTAG